MLVPVESLLVCVEVVLELLVELDVVELIVDVIDVVSDSSLELCSVESLDEVDD